MSTQPGGGAARPSIGILAVQFGLISQRQLMECLDMQRGEAADKDLDQILIDRGLLTRDAIEKLVKSYDESSKLQEPPLAAEAPTARQARPKTRFGDVRATGATGKRSTTAIIRDGAAARQRDAARSRDEAVTAAHRRHMTVGMLLALAPLLALGAYLVYVGLKPAPPPPPVVGGTDTAGDASGSGDVGRTPGDSGGPAPAVEGETRVRLSPLSGSQDLVQRWNRLAERINACRDAEQYKPMLRELEQLVTDAKRSAYETEIRSGYKRVIEAMNRRGKQVFEFIKEEAERLAGTGKFGESLKSWDWFPGNLDPGGEYGKQIESLKAATLETGRRHYQTLRTRAEKLADTRKFDQAKLTMLEALEMGLPEFTDDAYSLVSKYTDAEDAASRAAEEAQLEEFTKKARAEREVSQRLTAVRGQFWEMVSQRKFEHVQSFLRRQREGAPEDVSKEIDLLEKAFKDLKLAFTAVENALAALRGQQVAIAFVGGVKNLQLKDVDRGEIVYTIEGKQFTASVYDVAPTEIDRVADQQKDEERRDFLRGVACLLRDDFVQAHEALSRAKGEGATLTAFVERSSAFLEKNAPVYRENARKHMEAREWDKAVQDFSRLAAIPAERKAALRGRARAYFNLNNFVGTVLDVEQLFEMGDYGQEAIDLLNESYQRATLIAKAIRIYEGARKKVPENGAILENLVLLYLAIHEYEKARVTLGEATRISGTRNLGYAIHLLNVASEPAFAGQVFKAKFGRYDLETNVSQKYANEMAQFMDRVYKDYVKVFPYKKNETLRFHVKIFASESEFFGYYRKVTGGSPSSPFGKILAYYMPLTKELVGWNEPGGIEETMTHEGLHQYIDYFVKDCPIWFNEGYASYFEKSTADEARFNPGRHLTAKGLLESRQLPKLKDLFLMSGDVFRSRGAWHYGSSWSIIFYLHKQGRKSLLDRYFEELMAGKSQKQAFDAVFAKIDLDELESKWRKAIFNDDYEK